MLTREEVTALSGDALNLAVEHCVFGTPLLTQEEMETKARKVWQEQPQCVRFWGGFDAWREGDAIRCRQHARRFNEDWSAMGALWVEMARRGWHPLVMDNDGERIVCGYERRDGKYRQHSVDVPGVPDIPDGAAKAALLAVGGVHRD